MFFCIKLAEPIRELQISISQVIQFTIQIFI